MENDLASIKIRWHTLREEKMRAESMLQDVKRVEEELERLAEEKTQVLLDEKVAFLSMKFMGTSFRLYTSG